MKAKTKENDISLRARVIGGVVLTLVSILAVVAFVFWALIPHIQTVDFLQKAELAFNGGDPGPLLADDFIWNPNTYAQGIMRAAYLSDVFKDYNKGGFTTANPLLDDAFSKLKAYSLDNPGRYDYTLALAKADDTEAVVRNDPSYVKDGEQEYLAALKTIPGRQDVIYPYAINLINQGRGAEAMKLLTDTVAANPTAVEGHYRLGEAYAIMGQQDYVQALGELEYSFDQNFDPDPILAKEIYQKFLRYFYAQGDLPHFTTVIERLDTIDTTQGPGYKQVLDYIAKNHQIPLLNIVTDNSQ